MNIKITTFTNPFSFFCVIQDLTEHINFKLENQNEIKHTLLDTNKMTELNHGHYVAVLWKNKWTRGVVSVEKQFLIWLIDYGIFLHPTEKTFFKELPLEHRKIPTKVFEAGIHGVVPIDKVLTDDCQIISEISTVWTPGAIEKCQDLIKNAQKIIFQPVAILTTLHNNHIVLGDLYLEIKGKGFVNLTDELEAWPVFLEKNPEAFITNIAKFYVSRRRHRSCMLKPNLPIDDISDIKQEITLKEYKEILAKIPAKDSLFETESNFADGSTVVCAGYQDISAYKISPSDIEKYSNSYVTLNGREYNVLSVLVNKARDLGICERYKDHDLKSVGRGVSCRRSF